MIWNEYVVDTDNDNFICFLIKSEHVTFCFCICLKFLYIMFVDLPSQWLVPQEHRGVHTP